MNWQQLLTPNLDPVVYESGIALNDWEGWCLATVETAFGTARNSPTAWDAWLATALKHEDSNFPVGVYFPIWFSGAGGAGHVAIAYVNASGAMNIWTAPYTHTPYFFSGYTSVEALATGYNVTYVGWSEDLAGSTLIQAVTSSPLYTITPITPKQVQVTAGSNEWNLNQANFDIISASPFTTAGDNQIITVIATLQHSQIPQYTYYLEDASNPIGWNILDCTDYVPPVPVVPYIPPAAPQTIHYATTPIKLVTKIAGYPTAVMAASKTGSNISFESGIYVQFQTAMNGMLQVAKTPDAPTKYWINPADNTKTPPVVPPKVETTDDVRKSYKWLFPTHEPVVYKVQKDIIVRDQVQTGSPISVKAGKEIEIYGVFKKGGITYLRPFTTEVDLQNQYYFYGIATTDIYSGAPDLDNEFDASQKIQYGFEAFLDKSVKSIEGIFHKLKDLTRRK